MRLPPTNLRPLGLLALGCLFAAGCGHSRPTEASLDHAIHLEPRTADGTLSASEALDAAAQMVLETRLDQGADSIQPWTYTGPKPRLGPTGGLFVAGEVTSPARFGLAWQAAAPAFDTLELDLTLAGECTASVREAFADGTERTATFWVPFRPARAPLELFLGPCPTRAARIALEVTPSADEPRALELFALRLWQRALGAPDNPPEAGDEGLVQLGSQRRRVWAAAAGEALVARAVVPPDARLWVRAWAPPGPTLPFDATCTLHVGEAATPLVLRLPQQATSQPGQPQGLRFEADLADFAGEALEVRLEGGEHAESLTLGALWEAPLLLPSTPRTSAPTRRPDIVLVTLDTTRADFAGDARFAPRLAALGARGLVFPNAWSASNTTTPAHASIFTGQLPHTHRAIAVGKYGLANDAVTLAEVLRAAGYATAAVVSVEHIDAVHGFGQGFDRFAGGELADSRDGRRALALARDFLEDPNLDGTPRFLWVHWFDAHTPYELPAALPATFDAGQAGERLALPAPLDLPDWARNQQQLHWLTPGADTHALQAAYARGVRYEDWLLGQLLDTLDAAGRLDEALVAVTADHGEGLGERGIFASHVSLLPPVLRVPLVVKPPAAFPLELWPSAAALRAPVSSLDLLPTILELVGLESAAARLVGLAGRSLLAPDLARELRFEGDRLGQVGLLADGQLAIGTLRETDLHDGPRGRAGGVLLPGHHLAFDIVADLALERELFGLGLIETKLAARLAAALEETLAGSSGAALERSLSPAEAARLRALGYLDE